MSNENLLTPTKIVKSKRKSISLVIKNNGDFIVRAPLYGKDVDITNFINKKKSWIIKKRTEQLNSPFAPLTFNKPEKIALLGKNYIINYHNKSCVKIIDDELYLPGNQPKKKLISYLKRFAKLYISERLSYISDQIDLNFSTLTISSARTCWGSCSFNNRLHFTYKLIMCPPEVVDYIILHELCHTKVKNHSKQFWKLVESFNSNYKFCERWLKDNREVIDII